MSDQPLLRFSGNSFQHQKIGLRAILAFDPDNIQYPIESLKKLGEPPDQLKKLGEVEKAPDALTAARGTAALTAHLRIHLDKEDLYVYPIIRERTTMEVQAGIVGTMAKEVPPDRSPNLIGWLFPLLDLDDRVVAVNVWRNLLPPPVFSGMKPIIQQAVGATGWAELMRQIPELA